MGSSSLTALFYNFIGFLNFSILFYGSFIPKYLWGNFMILDLHGSGSKNGCVVLNELLAGGDRFKGAQLPATSARLDRSLLGMHLNSKPFFIQDRT